MKVTITEGIILRHTFCSHFAMQARRRSPSRRLAGHQDLATTQRYMHLTPAHKDAAIRLLDRRPTDDEAPLDFAPPSVALRSGRAEDVGDTLEATAPSAKNTKEVD